MQLKLFNLFSRVSYTLVIVSFLLPFLVVRCQNEDVFTATGIEVITGNAKMNGTNIQNSDLFPQKNPNTSIQKSENQNNNRELKYYGIAILILGMAGLTLSFLKIRQKRDILMINSFVGIILLFLMSRSINSQLNNYSSDFFARTIEIKMQEGFYICIVGFMITFVEPIVTLFKDEDYKD